MGPIDSPQTPEVSRNLGKSYHFTLRNITEERRSHSRTPQISTVDHCEKHSLVLSAFLAEEISDGIVVVVSIACLIRLIHSYVIIILFPSIRRYLFSSCSLKPTPNQSTIYPLLPPPQFFLSFPVESNFPKNIHAEVFSCWYS